MAGEASGQINYQSPLGDLAKTAAQILPLIFGSGKTSTVDTAGKTVQSGTSTVNNGTTTQSAVNGASPLAIAALLAQLQQAQNNAANPSAVDPIVQNIMRQATLAFTPVLAKEAASGLYNTSTRGLLAQEAANNATASASSAVLQYVTGQQSLANQAAQALAAATRTTDTTGNTANTSNTAGNSNENLTSNRTSSTASPLSTSNLLGAGASLLGAVGLKKFFDSDTFNKLSDWAGNSLTSVAAKLGMSDMLDSIGLGAEAGGIAAQATDISQIAGMAPVGQGFLGSPELPGQIGQPIASQVGSVAADAGGDGGADALIALSNSGDVAGEAASGGIGGFFSDASSGISDLYNSINAPITDALGFGLGEIFPVIGSAIPGLVSGNYAQAGVGAAGAGIGLLAGGPIGALIGGILGNLGGSFLGPNPESKYSSTSINSIDNQHHLAIGNTVSQKADTTAEVANLSKQLDAVNKISDIFGFDIAYGPTLPFQIGQNTPGKGEDPTKYADLFTPNSTGKTAFSNIPFVAQGNDKLQNAIGGDKRFNNLNDLVNAILASGAQPVNG